MKINKTIYHSNLLPPDSYTVEIGNKTKFFPVSEKKNIANWIKSVWKTEPEYHPAYIYFNIGWGNDHVLYCKYDWEIVDLDEIMFPEEHENDKDEIYVIYK